MPSTLVCAMSPCDFGNENTILSGGTAVHHQDVSCQLEHRSSNCPTNTRLHGSPSYNDVSEMPGVNVHGLKDLLPIGVGVELDQDSQRHVDRLTYVRDNDLRCTRIQCFREDGLVFLGDPLDDRGHALKVVPSGLDSTAWRTIKYGMLNIKTYDGTKISQPTVLASEPPFPALSVSGHDPGRRVANGGSQTKRREDHIQSGLVEASTLRAPKVGLVEGRRDRDSGDEPSRQVHSAFLAKHQRGSWWHHLRLDGKASRKSRGYVKRAEREGALT
ncbi:hypothetical protein JHW43_009566 [Diplocarpon mali]|nr:hypothetical protein JHW43_009566 [Diplocarpon mali]